LQEPYLELRRAAADTKYAESAAANQQNNTSNITANNNSSTLNDTNNYSDMSTNLNSAVAAVPPDVDDLPNVKVIDNTPNVRWLHTMIRDRTTSQEQFQFAVGRLSFILFSQGFDLLPVDAVRIVTPTNVPFAGHRLPKICGVSIVRSGEALEKTLREMVLGVSIGKIVIKQTSSRTDGPRLYYCKFPDLKGRKIILMDAILVTGNAATMAIRVLLDHGVSIEDILFFCLFATKPGLQMMLKHFPLLHVATTSVLDELDERHFATPGLGAFGDRYFGTASQHGPSIQPGFVLR